MSKRSKAKAGKTKLKSFAPTGGFKLKYRSPLKLKRKDGKSFTERMLGR